MSGSRNSNKPQRRTIRRRKGIIQAKPTAQFRSRLEAEVWKSRPQRENLSSSYESEKLAYTLHKKYIPDFIFEWSDGRKLYVEVKGYFRPEDKPKMKAVKASNPELDIRFVLANGNKRDTDWCDKYGFPYAIRNIPEAWFD